LGSELKRQESHKILRQMYIDRGFGKKIIEIGGSYNNRLQTVVKIVEEIINGKR
jgi:nicotinamide riboside kinase